MHVSAQYYISGRVTDDQGTGLEAADVFLHETHQGTQTDSAGNFKLEGIKAGRYHVHITYAGFHSHEQDVHVKSNITGINVILERSISELHELVIENSLEKSTVENNPLPVVYVDAHFMKQQGATSLVKGLEKIPGVSSLDNGVSVSRPSIRGLNGNRIVVTMDGIKQEGQQWGSDHGLEIDPNGAEKIEVIKGASSLMYGSDAVGGVINIRPTLPKGGEQYSINQILRYNSLNDGFRSSTSVSGNKKGYWYKMRYSFMQSGDYRLPADQFVYQTTVLPIYEQRLKNTAVHEDAFTGYLGMSRNWGYWYMKASGFWQRSGFFSGAFGVPNLSHVQHDGDFFNIDLPYQKVAHYNVSFHSNIQVKKNWLEVDLGIQRNDRSEVAIPHSAAFRNEDQDINKALQLELSTVTLNARYFLSDSVSKTILGVSGQWKDNQIGGYEFILPAYRSSLLAVYGLYKRPLRKGWLLSSGIRGGINGLWIDSTSTSYYKNGEFVGLAFRNQSLTNMIPNWSASVGLNKEIKKDIHLKLNLARTSRILQANELASNGLHHGAFRFEQGNPDLDTEQAIQSDVTLFYEHGRILLNVSGYFNHFFNFVYLQPSAQFARLVVDGEVYPYPEAGQLFTYRQSESQHTGFELEAEYKLWSTLKLTASSEYTRITNLTSGEYVPFVPPLSVKTGLEWIEKFKQKRLKEMHSEINFGYYAAQNRVPRNDFPTAAYQLLNFNTSLEFKFGLTLNAAVNNLLNTYYFSNLSRYKTIGLPEPGRSIVIQLEYDLTRKK